MLVFRHRDSIVSSFINLRRMLISIVAPAAELWSAFILLSNTRSAGFSGPNPISYAEIKTWKELTETPLDAREVEAIKSLDEVYMRVMNGRSN